MRYGGLLADRARADRFFSLIVVAFLSRGSAETTTPSNGRLTSSIILYAELIVIVHRNR